MRTSRRGHRLRDGRAHVLPTPYSNAELNAVATQIRANEPSPRVVSTLFSSCQLSDGFRVEVGFGDPETPELRAVAEALLAPFGDKVRMKFGVGWLKHPVGYAPAPPPEAAPPATVPDASRRSHACATTSCSRRRALRAAARLRRRSPTAAALRHRR